MLYGDVIAVCSEIHKKDTHAHTHTHYVGRTCNFLKLKPVQSNETAGL
jgi:hypothetical protein